MRPIIAFWALIGLITVFWTHSASAQACANLCEGEGWSYPEGRTVWEKSDVCTTPRLRIVGEPGQVACLPDDSWWPMVRVTCLVAGKPVPELHSPGTTGWVGASLCFDAPEFQNGYPGRPTIILP